MKPLTPTVAALAFLCLFGDTKRPEVMGNDSPVNFYFNGFSCWNNTFPAGLFDLTPGLTLVTSFVTRSRLDCLNSLAARFGDSGAGSSSSIIVLSYRISRDQSSWRCMRLAPTAEAAGSQSETWPIGTDGASQDLLHETCLWSLLSAPSCEEYEGEGRRAIVLLSASLSEEGTFSSCDLDTDGGGWTVIQRRLDGSVTFERVWGNYKNGFGDLSGEFWFGLDNIRSLVSAKTYELRVDMTTRDGDTLYAAYQSFSIGAEEADFQLTIDGYSGDAGDFLSGFNGAGFHSSDRETESGLYKCAWDCLCAFWFSESTGCANGNPNAEYGDIFWPDYSGFQQVVHYLSFVEMKIRPTATNNDTGLAP